MKKFILFFFAMVLSTVTGFAKDVVFDVTVNPGEAYTDDSGTKVAGPQSITINGVTIAESADSQWDAQYRIYKNHDFTVTSAVGAIAKIEFTCTASGDAKYGPGCFSAMEGYSYDGAIGTWVGEAEQVVFHAESNQVRATRIVVTLAEKEGEVDLDKVNIAAVNQADFVAGGKWYLLKQKRGGVSPVYDAGVGETMKRAANDKAVVAGMPASDAVDYLLRFIPASEGAYNIQFANGHYWASTMTTTEEDPGEYNVYNINGEATHIGINKFDMENIVDNNGAGNTLAFWESGEVTKLDGNNDWTVWEVEFVEKSEAAAELKALVDEYEAAFNANNVVVEVGEGIITSTDQFSSEYTDEEEGSLANLLDGDGSTFWHSTWHHGNDTPMHVHYLQVEFTEPISGAFELNMNRRVNNGGMCQNDNPVKMSVETSLDGEEFVLADEFDTPFTQSGAAPLVQATVNIPTPAKYLRFFADECNGGANRGYWHCGDFQLKPIVTPAPNAAYPEAAAAFAEALAAAKEAGANATGADVAALQAAYAAYLKGLQPAPEGPVYCTAAQIRENAEKGRFALLGVTATGDHYLNGEVGDHVSADGTLAGVRDPEANEIIYLVKSGDQYLIQREDTKQFFQIAAGQNIVLVDDATAATPFEIYGKDDEGYPTGGFDDLFSDLEQAYDDYMIRFKANGQWLNTQGANSIGGLRGGTGAWSFQYVRYMGEHEVVTPEPTAVTFEIAENEDGTFTVTPSDPEALYFYNVYSEAIRNEWYYGANANDCVKVDVENYISEPDTETHKGVSKLEPASWLRAFYGAEYPYGDYQVVVVAIDQVGAGYAVAGDVFVHNYTYAAPVNPEPTFPEAGVAYKVKNLDSSLYLQLIDNAEQNVTLNAEPKQIFFTAVNGGWTISNEAGYVMGATSKGWNIGNTADAIVWTVEEVEGGYALKNEKGYLGFDTAAAGQMAFRDKNYATHHGVFNIWKFDEEEPQPIEPERTLNDVWNNIHTLLAEAEGIMEFNEVTLTYDGDGYFADFTSPIVGKVGYKKHDDVWAVCDGVDYVEAFVSYFTTAEEAEEYLADFGGIAALEEILKNVISDYNEAEVALPEAGKTYVIRNQSGNLYDEDRYSYAFYLNDGALSTTKFANAIAAEHMWTCAGPVEYSYFDNDLNVFTDTRYQFYNAKDNDEYFAWKRVDTDASKADTKWYLTGKNLDGSASPVYGTIAMHTYADNNQFRLLVIDMRDGAQQHANGHCWGNTFSDWYWFEEVEVPISEWDGEAPVVTVVAPETVKVTFTDANTVEASNYGVLGAIFDESGDAYALAFNDLFGDETVEFAGDHAILHFKKISDLNAELAGAAHGVAAKIGAGANADVKGKILIASRSFKIDGEALYNELIVADYDFSNGQVTNIETIALDSNVKVFDLQGRRVVLPAKGLVIANGKKVVK